MIRRNIKRSTDRLRIPETLIELRNMGTSLPEELMAIYLYGSSVAGKLRMESDVDIAILPSHQTTEEQRLIRDIVI